MRIAIKLLSVLFLVCIHVLTGCATGQISSSELSRAQENEAKKITLESVCEEILAMPEENINLGKYVLLITKCVYPEVNMENELKKIECMAAEIRPRLKGIAESQKIVEILNKYFFDEMEFRGFTGNEGTPDSYFFHNALRQRKSHCLSSGIIYLVLAERLNLPVYGVLIPGHFFIRYDDGNTQINIDTTFRPGKNISDEEYLKILATRIKQTDMKIRRDFLTNLTKKEVLGAYLENTIVRKLRSGDDKNIPSALKYTDYVIRLFPNSYSGYCIRGGLLTLEKNHKQALEYYLKGYNLYPYDMSTIINLIRTYYELNNYRDCLDKIEELYKKYPPEIYELDNARIFSIISATKKKCEEKLGIFFDLDK
ncbi:MAG: transglutaminase-like domain-containing protein [Planctomycetota bacterium]